MITLPMAWSFALAAALLTAVAQLMLKMGALQSRGLPIPRLWLNPWVATSYGFFFIVTLLNLYAFQVLELKLFVILNSLVLLVVVAGSCVFFGEIVNRKTLAGMGLLLAGVLVFNL